MRYVIVLVMLLWIVASCVLIQETRYPTGYIDPNCVGEIVWHPTDVWRDVPCGDGITVTRINSSFVHIKTCG